MKGEGMKVKREERGGEKERKKERGREGREK